jgi:hypothetical protein
VKIVNVADLKRDGQAGVGDALGGRGDHGGPRQSRCPAAYPGSSTNGGQYFTGGQGARWLNMPALVKMRVHLLLTQLAVVSHLQDAAPEPRYHCVVRASNILVRRG